MSDSKKPAMCPMVGWYDPIQLARTAVDVAESTIFGRNADYRITEALATPDEDVWEDGDDGQAADENGIYDYSDPDSIWIDYIADTGDGWHSTYSVAYYVSREALQVEGTEEVLPRGQLMIFGGDEVYPTAHRNVYRDRLIQPFENALEKTDPNPHVFAIPGNHDWYDSLVSFTRLFCSRRWFGGWKTRQNRSYFALKLPHRWWLIGTDVQLDSDIDTPQVKYFRHVAKQMGKHDRIILCTAEPHWIYATTYGKYDDDINENNLAFLERKIFCNQTVPVYLSGDLHHYRRHATDAGFQKITAGGGGAFLHPTHGEDVSVLNDGYRLKAAAPSISESKKIAWKNLGFLFMNPKFGLVTGLIYALTCWSVMADLSTFGIRDWYLAARRAISTSVGNPTAVFWIAALFFGFVFFTDTHSKRYKRIAGPIHGGTHLLSMFFIGWAATYLTVNTFHWQFKSVRQLITAGIIIFAAGWVVGSIVMGIYLLVSLNFFRRHANEAFSALASPDWKNFLKLRIDQDGALTIFPVGIRRVPRHWKETNGITKFAPDDPRATKPALIEPPIVIPGAQ